MFVTYIIVLFLEPWLDTSTPDPDTTPTLPRHYPDTSTLRHQCQPTLGPTLRHQCQASVKPSRQITSSTDVKRCQGCQVKIDTPTLDTPDTPDTPTLRHLHTHTRATSTRHGRPAGASWACWAQVSQRAGSWASSASWLVHSPLCTLSALITAKCASGTFAT